MENKLQEINQLLLKATFDNNNESHFKDQYELVEHKRTLHGVEIHIPTNIRTLIIGEFKIHTQKHNNHSSDNFIVIIEYRGYFKKVCTKETWKSKHEHYNQYEYNKRNYYFIDIDLVRKILNITPSNKFEIIEKECEISSDVISSGLGDFVIDSLIFNNCDFEYFINYETKNGTWSPTNLIWYYSNPSRCHKLEKNILHKQGIKEIVLSKNYHFDVSYYFDLSDIKIKAPKEVLRKYEKLQNYTDDNKKLLELKKEKDVENRQLMLKEYNDTYSLIHRGKVVLTDVKGSVVNYYINNIKSINFENELLESVKLIFDNYKIEQLYICKFGNDYHDNIFFYNFECLYEINGHLDEKDVSEICEFYYNKIIFPEEGIIKKCFDITREQYLGIRKTKKGLEIFTENIN